MPCLERFLFCFQRLAAALALYAAMAAMPISAQSDDNLDARISALLLASKAEEAKALLYQDSKALLAQPHPDMWRLYDLAYKLNEFCHVMDCLPDAINVLTLSIPPLEDRGFMAESLKFTAKLGEDLIWVDRPKQAAALLRQGLERYREAKLNLPGLWLELTANLANALKDADDYDAALSVLTPVLPRIEQDAALDLNIRAFALNTLSRIYRRQGKLEDALYFAGQAVRAYEAAGETSSLNYAVKLEAMSRIEWSLRNAESSIAHLQKALEIYRSYGDEESRDVILMTSFLAERLLKTGKRQEAVATARRAHRLALAKFQNKLNSPQPITNNDRIYLQYAVQTLLSALRAADASGERNNKVEAAFQAAQPGAWSAIAQDLKITALQTAHHDNTLSEMIAARNALYARLAAIQSSLDMLRALADPQQAAKIAKKQREKIDLDAETNALSARIDQHFPNFRRLTSPGALSVAAVQKRLDEDEALVFPYALYDDLYVFAVTRKYAAWHVAHFERGALCQLVARHRNSLDVQRKLSCTSVGSEHDNRTLALDAGVIDAGLAHELYQRIFGPVAALIEDKRHWLILPTGPLTALPFGTLLTAAPTRSAMANADDFRKGRWLGREHSLSILPSIESLSLRRYGSARQQTRNVSFIGIGDPCLAGHSACPSAAARYGADRFPALAPLPGSKKELKAIAASLDRETNLLFAQDANEARVKSLSIPAHSIVAFATHALVAGEYGLSEPALVLSKTTQEQDGLLLASEIAGLSIPADLVILSGCNTAAPNGAPRGQMLSGLVQSFFQAGAKSVLAAHFQLLDGAATEITVGMFRHLKADPGIDRAEALRRAIADAIDNPARRYLAHPANWGAFMLIGAAR